MTRDLPSAGALADPLSYLLCQPQITRCFAPRSSRGTSSIAAIFPCAPMMFHRGALLFLRS